MADNFSTRFDEKMLMSQYPINSLIARWARSVAAKLVFIMSSQSYWYLVTPGVSAGVSCDQVLAFYPPLPSLTRAFRPFVMSWCRNPDISIFVFTLWWTNIINIRCWSRMQRELWRGIYCTYPSDTYSVIWIPRRRNVPRHSPRVSCLGQILA